MDQDRYATALEFGGMLGAKDKLGSPVRRPDLRPSRIECRQTLFRPQREATVGFYAQVIFPRLCDFMLGMPFVARYRQELLATVSGDVLEIGFGTGLNLPHYPAQVRKITVVDPNIGMHRLARQRIKTTGIEVDQR